MTIKDIVDFDLNADPVRYITGHDTVPSSVKMNMELIVKFSIEEMSDDEFSIDDIQRYVWEFLDKKQSDLS